MSYEGRINPAKRPVQDRGKIGKVEKNLPETFYEKTIGHLFKTIGAYTKEKKRPQFILKETNRKKAKSYTGIAGPSTEEKHESRPWFKKIAKILIVEQDLEIWQPQKNGRLRKMHQLIRIHLIMEKVVSVHIK